MLEAPELVVEPRGSADLREFLGVRRSGWLDTASSTAPPGAAWTDVSFLEQVFGSTRLVRGLVFGEAEDESTLKAASLANEVAELYSDVTHIVSVNWDDLIEKADRERYGEDTPKVIIPGIPRQPRPQGGSPAAKVDVFTRELDDAYARWMAAAAAVRASVDLRDRILRSVMSSMEFEGFKVDLSRSKRLLEKALEGPPLRFPGAE